MLEVLTPAEMRAVDHYTIHEIGIPGAVLMESAGSKVVDVIERVFGSEPRGRTAIVLAGKGNNGGDGSVVARRLMGRGWTVSLVLVARPFDLTGDAQLFWEAAAGSGVPCFQYDGGQTAAPLCNVETGLQLTQALESCSVIVDALLGTGARRAPEGAVWEAIDLANASGKPVVAVDLPSGIDSHTGEIPGACIMAQETVTFCRPKAGMTQYPAARACGRLWVADIGIPQAAVLSASPTMQVITRESAIKGLPKRQPWAHKGDAGRALFFCGSVRYPGAAYLCASGCLRGGAGLVTAVVPGAAWPVLAAKLNEVMVLKAGAAGQAVFDAGGLEAAEDLLKTATAICAGPGITTSDGVAGFVAALLEAAHQPVVLDADALNLLAGSDAVQTSLQSLSKRATPVLTPHPAEAARLLGWTVDKIQSDRLTAALRLADKYECTVALKGARTVVAYCGRLWINATGNPGLATGGTGDVLAGLITSLIAQGADAVDAACAGVFVHGLAADILAAKSGAQGMTAGDVAQMLPEAIETVRRGDCCGNDRDRCRLMEFAMYV